MSDTPRTDRACFQPLNLYAYDYVVRMDFARTLERQLAALRARLDAAHAREDELVAIISSMDFSFERAQSDEVHENLDSALYRYAAAKEQRNKQ